MMFFTAPFSAGKADNKYVDRDEDALSIRVSNAYAAMHCNIPSGLDTNCTHVIMSEPLAARH